MRKNLIACVGLAALVVTSVYAQTPQAGAAQAKGPNSARFEATIKSYEVRDKQPPIVFIGSSSIRRWNLTEFFPGMNVINYGFGGSEMADLPVYAARLIFPKKPVTIVVYSGNNDLERGEKPEVVAQNFAKFVDIVRSQLPKTKIIYLGMKPQPNNWKDIETVKQGNTLLEAYAKSHNVIFIDTFKPLLSEKGELRPELYLPDGQHLTPPGYQIWQKLVQPLLTQGATTN